MSGLPDFFDMVTPGGTAHYVRQDYTPPAFRVYGQRDPRWANEVYAGGSTFGAYGCLVCSVAMMVGIAYSEEILPPEVAARLRDAGCFQGNLLSLPGRIPLAYERLTWDGVVHYRNVAADMNFVRQHVEDNGAVIAEVAFDPRFKVHWVDSDGVGHWNQHFVVITRVIGDDVEIADPWEGNLVMLTESRFFRYNWPKKASRVITGLRLVGVE